MSLLEIKQLLTDYLMTGRIKEYVALACYAYEQLNKSQALEALSQNVPF